MPLVSDFEDQVITNESRNADEHNEDDIPVTPAKKIFAKKRLVHDIESTLDQL